MQDLLKINYETEEPTVSARELYDRLNIKSNFTTWFRRMCEYGFEDGKDFFPKVEESTGGRPSEEFAMKIDMASKGGIRDVLQDRKDTQRNGKHYRNLDDGWCVLSEKSGAVLLICSTWNHNTYYWSICTGIFPDTGMAVPEKENKGGEGTCRKRSSVRSGFGWRS